FVVLAIDIQEKREVVKEYVEQEKLPFPVLMDFSGQVAFNYGVRAHPAHYLINGKGELVASILGPRDWASNESRNLIRFLLDQDQEG
ncbi:MAG: TlpA family protein disulfide reductase, partial [candidate division Zixibacteria bacterium]|nr:TlpA family protein disulfide reductase [candidate division Zixibacteria bacterium]